MSPDDSGPLVVDTDVVSYIFRGDTRAELFRSVLAGRVLIVSFMTVAELERWALGRDWGPARMATLERFLDRFTQLPFDWPLCRR